MGDILHMTSTQVVGLFDGTESRSILDNPNLPLNDPRVWDEVFGDSHSTDAGLTITAQRAMECAPFWQAVQLIAGDAGMIPLAPYKRKTGSGRTYWEESPEHWTYSLCRIQANDDETSQDYWERLLTDALIWNDGWGLIDWGMSTRPIALYHLLPDRTSWEWVDGMRYCVTEIDGRVKAYLPEDVLHISGLKPGGMVPNFVKQARNTIAAALAANSFVSKFFKNGARSGGILELPREMPKPVQQQVEEGFRKTYEGGDAAFKTVILRDNAKFHAAQTSPRDVQSVEASERLARDVARWFGLPASMLNVEGTSSYNSKSQDSTGYATHCLSRWLGKIASQCRLRLLPKRERAATEYRHDTDQLFTMDLEARMRAYSTGIACKVLNPNDGRIAEGLPPYDDGEEFENPNTSSPMAGDAADTEEPADAGDMPARAVTMDEKRGLVACCLNARHKAARPNAFVDFVGKIPDAAQWQVDLRAAFNLVIETTTADGLPAAVESVCAKYEQIYLG
jgi:HK97 family phage portal protein